LNFPDEHSAWRLPTHFTGHLPGPSLPRDTGEGIQPSPAAASPTQTASTAATTAAATKKERHLTLRQFGYTRSDT